MFYGGTAWLSSGRVVECYIYLLNGRNLYYKCRLRLFIKDTLIFILINLYYSLMKLFLIYIL